MRTISAVLILLHSAIGMAGALEEILVAPSKPQQAGQIFVFSVYLNNSGDEPICVDLPETVLCRLKSTGQTIEVTARSIRKISEDQVIIREKGFLKIQYALTVPDSVEGAVSMEVPAFNGASVIFAVNPGPPASKETEVRETDDSELQKYVSLDSLFALYQPYLGNIAAHEPMYFLVGADPKKSKFQLSLKYRFVNPVGPMAQSHPWTKGFHFAYTQTSFWDLESESMPFKDTSYKPELFFLSSNMDTGASGIRRLFLQTGFQHESNGRGDEYSRSTNFFYVKPIFIFFNEKNRLGLQVVPKVWTYVKNDNETNPDLADYRGYFDLGLKLGKADSFVLGSNLRWAKEGGSMQLDLTYPLRWFLFGNLDLYLQVQYVNGLAESLINYKERNEALRFGISIVR